MENQPYPASKHALVYGAYVTAALIVLSLAFYVLDLYGQTWTGYISYAVLLIGVVIASYHYRDNHLGGFITYGQSFMTGFLTALFAAIGVGIFSYIFMSLMPPEFTQNILDQAEEKMLENNPELTDEQIDMAMNMTKKFMNPGMMAGMAFLAYTFFGVIFSLLASIFIKREDDSMGVEA